MLSIKRWWRCRKWNVIAQRIPTVRRRYITHGSRFAAELSSRYWAQVSRRALPGSATLSKRHCARSTCNIRALLHRLLIAIRTDQPHENRRCNAFAEQIESAPFDVDSRCFDSPLSKSENRVPRHGRACHWKKQSSRSPPHDKNRQNATLMTRKQVIDKVANDRVRFVSKLRNDPANQSAAARVPFEINRSGNISGAMYLRPTMWTSGLFGPDFDEPKFPL